MLENAFNLNSLHTNWMIKKLDYVDGAQKAF